MECIIAWLLSGFIIWNLNSFKKINKTLNLIAKEISLPDKVVQLKIKDLNKITLHESPKELAKDCLFMTLQGPLALKTFLKGSLK